MKNNNLLSVIALVLVISAIAGLFILVFSMFDSGVFGEISENEEVSDTMDPDSVPDAPEEPENTDTFYLDPGLDTGYVIHEDRTYFFKRFRYDSELPCGYFSLMNSCVPSKEYSIEMVWTKNPFYKESFDYSNTSPQDLYKKNNLTICHCERSSDWVYIIPLSMLDCDNPVYWLEDLNQSFFMDPEKFRVKFAGGVG